MEEAEEGGARKKKRGGWGGRHCCSINDVVGEELLTEILIRLPLDHIFRGKSVCKRWLSLIQTPHFAACYTKKQQQQTSSSSLGCHLNAHPQQRSPVLIGDRGERLAFSLDFVPGFAQLHGAHKHHHLLQQAAADDRAKNPHEKLVLGSSNGLLKRTLIILPGDPVEPKKVEWSHPPSVYTTRDLVLGSSNGLLLCAPLLFTSNPQSKFDPAPVFDDFPTIYAVCNPHTKQWLPIPKSPPFPSSHSVSPHAANVGFVSGFDSSGGNCWFKIVRLGLDLKSPHRRSLELQVFSSQSWEWTAVTVSSLPRPIGPDNSELPIVAVTLLKKNDDGPRLCWLLNGTQAIVYNPLKNVVDAVIGPTCKTVRAGKRVVRTGKTVVLPKVVVLDAICVSNDCMWGGSLHNRLRLKIYRASGTEWEMVKEFDMMQLYRPGGEEPILITYTWNTFLAMNPHDPEQVYLKTRESVDLLDLRSGILKVVGVLDKPKNNLLQQSTIVCDNPLWPTPIPSPPLLSCS